ncbi:hypothetical protein KCP74_14720 [Salmonella enterica subsp. enterica]|nr:hypothetical protein KCP74_14720 [Salmonella enterica subsp. enterica]
MAPITAKRRKNLKTRWAASLSYSRSDENGYADPDRCEYVAKLSLAGRCALVIGIGNAVVRPAAGAGMSPPR